MTDQELHVLALRLVDPELEWDASKRVADWALRLEAERDKTREELELQRMQAAACMTAAISNTAETVAQRIGRDHPYWSTCYQDVCNAVDLEMRHRVRAEQAEAALASAKYCEAHQPPHDSCPCCEAVHVSDELAACQQERNDVSDALDSYKRKLAQREEELAALRAGLTTLERVGWGRSRMTQREDVTDGWIRWSEIAALLDK